MCSAWVPSPARRARAPSTQRGGWPSRLPPHARPPPQGTSVPIAIPNLPRWKPGDAPPAPAPAGPAPAPAGAAPAGPVAAPAPRPPAGDDTPGKKFVPPHQLTRHEDFTFSFNGASPSACLKRERLRARNAILRSTGFLEPKDGPGGGGGALLSASVGGGGLHGPPGGVAQSLPAQSGLLRFEQQRAAARAAAPPASSLTAALTTIGEAA